MNLTDLLIGIVVALTGTIAALIVWIWNQHRARVDEKFNQNDEDHKVIRKEVGGVRSRVDHLIHFHKEVPDYNDD